MNQKRVLDVGNCDPDHASISGMLRCIADVQIDRVMHVSEAMQHLEQGAYDLVLVNRLIFADGSEGLPLIEQMAADDRFRDIPVMMISNHPDAQERAVAAGAKPGFGKAALNEPATHDALRAVLTRSAPASGG